MAGAAIARVIVGDAEPTGRLSVSIAKNEGQLPVYYNQHIMGKIHGWEERYHPYLDQKFAPQYPFGFGLGYTTWEYSDVSCDQETIAVDGTVRVSATLTNTGARAGTTVAQCYIHDVAASTCRPKRELKAFERVTVAAGESVQVDFDLGPEQLQFYGADKTWSRAWAF